MKKYRVTVKQTILEFYEVRAETAAEAKEYWMEGDFLGSDDTHLDSQPLKVVEIKKREE